MNVLFERFPQTVDIDGHEYRIVTDFREWIKLSELLKEVDRFTAATLEMLLEWYIDVPPDTNKAICALQAFLSAEGLYVQEDAAGNEAEDVARNDGKPVYSFTHDAHCIYSDFQAVYGIDIETNPYMHWWKFLTLFGGLPADTETKERIYYRGVDLNEIKDKEERKRIKEIKKRLALPECKGKMNDYQIGDVFG